VDASGVASVRYSPALLRAFLMLLTPFLALVLSAAIFDRRALLHVMAGVSLVVLPLVFGAVVVGRTRYTATSVGIQSHRIMWSRFVPWEDVTGVRWRRGSRHLEVRFKGGTIRWYLAMDGLSSLAESILRHAPEEATTAQVRELLVQWRDGRVPPFWDYRRS
jgi:hypothetical protein